MRKVSGLIVKARLVPAMLDGTKTQTRRVVALPRKRSSFVVLDHGDGWWPFQSDDGESAICSDGNEHPYAAPYGVAGDLIYMRESGAHMPLLYPDDPEQPYLFRHDVPSTPKVGHYWVQATRERGASYNTGCTRAQFLASPGAKVVPAIFMPRWAARLWVEIKGLKVERLQDISEADASCEGLQYSTDRKDHWCGNGKDWRMTAREAFRDLWIDMGGSWEANPWVWAYRFEHLAAQQQRSLKTTFGDSRTLPSTLSAGEVVF